MNQIIINGQIIAGNASSINMSGNKIFIDGKDMTPDAKEITVVVQGNLENLDVQYAKLITIEGNAKSVKSTSGDITIKNNVEGSVKTTSGDVECNDVAGDVETISGDVKAKSINGRCKTVSGDIHGSK